MVEPVDCPECGAEVWPSSLEEAQKECNDCGAKVKLKDWPDEWLDS